VPNDPVAQRGHQGRRRQGCAGNSKGVDERGNPDAIAEREGVNLTNGGQVVGGLPPDQQVSDI
jgi:hypothetical protein